MQNMQVIFPLIATLLFGLASWIPIGWRIRKDPKLKVGYTKVFIIWLIWLNYWMASGVLKHVPGNQDPRLVGKIVIGAVAILGTLWIFLGRGDKTLEKYPGFFMFPVGRAARIRIYWVLLMAFLLAFYFLPASLIASLKYQYPPPSGPVGPPPLSFPVFFVGTWILVGFLLSLTDGWQWLSEEYRFKDKFEGRWQGGISGMLCAVGFRGILKVGADQKGLYLGVLFLFRAGHPSLFVPWKDITCGKNNVLIWDYAVIEFEKAPGVLLMIPSKTARKLSEESGSLDAFKGL